CSCATPTISSRGAPTSTSTTSSPRRTRPPAWPPSARGQSDIHFVASLNDAAAIKKTNPAAVIQEYKTVQTVFGLALAQAKPPYNDVRVRRAISMAIDRQKQVDTIHGGHGILGWGIPYFYFQDKMPTAAKLGPYWQYKPTEAKRLLTESGHP